MADKEKTKLRLEIAHVLFMDIVGYSKLLMDEQSEALHELNRVVRGTEAVQEAEAAGQLIRLPTGDGMALVFTSCVEAPVECALEVSQALRAQPSLPLRMGIHSGPVQHVEDVNGRHNIAGAGINLAQRVMDCGDAGHILISKRVADDLATSRRWQPYLHELGDAEVKHGVVISLVNLYADAVGNTAPPAKFRDARVNRRQLVPAAGARPAASRWLLGVGALLAVAVAGVFALRQRPADSHRTGPAVARPVPSAMPGTSPAPVVAAPVIEAPEKSIAVLPFDNFSEDKDSAFFADGVQDEVLTDLAKVADLKVTSRSSVMQYKEAKRRNLREIGQTLGVSHVVEGSVQRAGNKIRVTAQLIDARTDAHQWAEHYDRDLADVFAIQSDIAQSIAKQLQAAVSPQEHAAMTEAPTHDEQAYQLYLRALAKWYNPDQPGDLRSQFNKILGLLRQATERDPNFARAFAMTTMVQASFYTKLEPTPAQAETVRGLAETVARLRPDSADAHKAAGIYYLWIVLDQARAREEFARAAQLSPNDTGVFNFLSGIDQDQGRYEDALADVRKALALDPENTTSMYMYIAALETLHRYSEACTELDRWLAVHPQAMWPHPLKASLFLRWKGNSRAARAEVAQLAADFDSGLVTSIRLDCDYFERDFTAAARDLAACRLNEILLLPRAWYEGRIAYLRGDPPAAAAAFQLARATLEKRTLAQPKDSWLLMSLARTDAFLDRKEQALAEGHQALVLSSSDKNAGIRSIIENGFARLLVSTGERDEPIRILQRICGHPGGPDYGDLRFDPSWEPLRGDPRFEALVVSLTPKP